MDKLRDARCARCRTAIKLFPAVITHSSGYDRGDGGLVGSKRDITRRVKEMKV